MASAKTIARMRRPGPGQRNPATLADTIEIDAPSTTNHAIVITDGTFDITVTPQGG